MLIGGDNDQKESGRKRAENASPIQSLGNGTRPSRREEHRGHDATRRDNGMNTSNEPNIKYILP